MTRITFPTRISPAFGHGFNEFFIILNRIRELNPHEPIELDMTNCSFLTPFFILPIVLLIKEETKIVNEFSNRTTVKYVEDNITNFAKLNFELLAGLGADYDINKHFKLRLEPLFRRSINSITTTDIKGYLYSGGLNFGVYYRF